MKYKYKYGVGITTKDRKNVFKHSYSQWQKYLPMECKLVVVDDGSLEPVEEYTVRNETPQGIARAKNQCLELLDDCEHIFLSDDDFYPTKFGWEKLYSEGKEPHYMYIFEKFTVERPGKRNLSDCHRIYEDSEVIAYSHVRGCLLYVHHSVLNKVGGFDETYGIMYEHSDYTNRIYNAGLTSFRVMDVHNSHDYFYSLDEHRAVKTSIDPLVRRNNLRKHRDRYANSYESSAYMPYIHKSMQHKDQNNIILTCYFTGISDPQRGKWDNNLLKDCEELIVSVRKHKQKVVIPTYHQPAIPEYLDQPKVKRYA